MENITNGYINPKLDYYTSIWSDSSIRDVLSFIDCSDCLNDFYMEQSIAIRGLGNAVVFKFNGIELSIQVPDVMKNYKDLYGIEFDIIDAVFDSIRLNIGGVGLDFLRSRGFDCDNRLRVSLSNFHLTRCDIAFDFVNYMPDFLPKMVEHLRQYHLRDSDRVRIMNLRSGLSYSVKTGNQTTVYLGGTQSDKLLRVYDKKRQYTKNGVWLEPCPYGTGDGSDIDSWFRMELQLRNQRAENILFADNGDEFYLSVLKYIYDSYCFTKIDSKVNFPEPVDFWEELWPWQEIPTIIQNANSVQIECTVDRVQNNINRCTKNILVYVDVFGFEGLKRHLLNYIEYLFSPQDNVAIDYVRKRRLLAFLKDKNEYCSDTRCENHIHIRDGIIYYND